MVKTTSIPIKLGTKATKFSLLDVVSGKKASLETNEKIKGTVIMFICNHCPFVKHVNKELTKVANDYIKRGIQFFAINSNDITLYPDDDPTNMQQVAKEQKYPFPYLFDETQEVAKAYQAACTPDFFVYNDSLNLVYHGQLDDSRPNNNIPVSGSSIRETLDCLIAKKPINPIQKPSIGCNIKWKI